MSAASLTGDGEAPAPRRLTIGKVLASLSTEFPDVTASKIRFLEAEGLVRPHRTASGYRTYTEGDVARLHYILAAQRDRYWPLKVIREALDALDRGLSDPGDAPGGRPRPPAPSADPEVPAPEALAERHDVALTGPELREATGIDRDTMHALETYGLLQPDERGHFGHESLAIAAAAHALGERLVAEVPPVVRLQQSVGLERMHRVAVDAGRLAQLGTGQRHVVPFGERLGCRHLRVGAGRRRSRPAAGRVAGVGQAPVQSVEGLADDLERPVAV